MARYIDLDKVTEHKNSYCNTTSITHCNRDCAECFYNNGSAEDVVPVIHAEWINKSSSSFDGVFEKAFPLYVCTNCKRYSEVNFDFCPNCGAKMK